MKNLLLIFLLLTSSFIVFAQEYTPISNRWKKDGKTTYNIHTQNATVEAGATKSGWWSAQWEFVKVAGTNYYQIRNRWKKDFYLHNQNGKLEAGKIEQGWWSAQWILESSDGGYYFIKNRWKQTQYIHNQESQIAVGPIQKNWWSAQWTFKLTNAPTPVPAPKQTNTPVLNNTKNIALYKKVYQSSTAHGGLAAKAIDGNTNGQWSKNSISHTDKESYPWWEIDLGSTYDISKIEIFNREDCCKERLDKIDIYVKRNKDDNGSRFNPKTLMHSANQANPISISNTRTGRYIRIKRSSFDPVVLSLAEVKIYGKTASNTSSTGVKKGIFNVEMVNKTDCGGSQVFADDISAIDNQFVWRRNVANLIERSKDGGKTFSATSGLKKLTCVSAVDNSMAWGIDNSDNIYYTTNSGGSWTKTSGAAVTVSAVSSSTAWVISKAERIYFTNNAGKTWNQTPGAAVAVSAVSASTAWVVNKGGLLYNTVNAGKKWNQNNKNIKMVSAINAMSAWCIDKNMNIQVTNDGGKTWKKDTEKYLEISVLSSRKAYALNTCGDLVLLTF